ncbi:hypothetical protein MCUN1_003651 [Malassezia cuniculi]|uniref:Uncharacterized protein n=1 Tax=Malassezia cuniculi TaxID=948313 RepID=A0AAF0J8E9_9BASI|nr:hypothetical protein MCUN1_003651 [Malassezia cuniculi]
MKLVRVFRTLSQRPDLARLVRILEIRVFPFGLAAERLEALEEQIETALGHMHALVALHWTRTGSLSDRLILSMFAHMRALRTVEISGDSRAYSPTLLVDHMPRTVTRLAVVLPDRRFGASLVGLVAALPLESLSVVALQSPVVTDAMLSEMAPYAPNLHRLVLAGCKAVRGHGVLDILRTCAISELSLEGLSISNEMLGELALHFDTLRSLTLTHPGGPNAPFFAQVQAIVHSVPLHTLVIYAKGGSPPVVSGEQADAPATAYDSASNPSLTTSFVKRLIFGRSSRLRTLRIQGIAVSLYQLQMISMSTLSDTLEDLVVHLYEGNCDELARCVARFRRLRLLHIQSHPGSNAEFSEEQLATLAGASPTLRKLGYRNRMWQVDNRTLYPWDMAAGVFPETMMIVRA